MVFSMKTNDLLCKCRYVAWPESERGFYGLDERDLATISHVTAAPFHYLEHIQTNNENPISKRHAQQLNNLRFNIRKHFLRDKIFISVLINDLKLE